MSQDHEMFALTDGYVVNGTSSRRGRGYNYTAAYYGINNLMNATLDDFGNLPNATYVHSDYKELELGAVLAYHAINNYSITASEFSPIPEVVSSNGSTTLISTSYHGLYMERYLAGTATGPPGRFAKYTANAAENDSSIQWYCNNFILRDNSYTFFSVLAISLMLGFGGLVTCSSLYLEVIVGWIHARSKSKRGHCRRMYWRLDSALQLQRMAFEETGLGTWERCIGDIPIIAASSEKIRVATEWDERHPSIRGKELPLSSLSSRGEEKIAETETFCTLSEASTAVTPKESKAQASITETEMLAPTTTAERG
ncbi:hypothetical protein BDZ45DRAFT_810932 [Acephala macrosclerotiorum]|nr:hypothetical protein BDZ45DRAFT_810932 [Acephala macrosclerotiorum]